MAPSSTRGFPRSALSTKDKHKLRKPLVEKMRRDRINTCIEQLKALLEKDFQKQEPSTKLEKADVLEMTVMFLQQQLRPQSAAPHAAHRHGYARCWEETLHFLSAHSAEEVALPRPPHLQAAQKRWGGGGEQSPASPPPPAPPLPSLQSPHKQSPGAPRPVWRPW